MNGLSRFIWGYLMDKLGFTNLMIVITFLEIIISTSLYFTVKYPILYAICVLIVSSCLGGHFAILLPQFNKTFGFSVGPELYGITGIFIGIASICGPLINSFILKSKKDFLIVFLVGGGLCMIKLLITLIFEEEEQFIYKEKKKLLFVEYNNNNNKKVSEANIQQILDDDDD